MNILIVFDTYSGGTLDATTYVNKLLSEKNHQVVSKKVSDVTHADFSSSEFIIFATPSWYVDNKDGQPHINFKDITESNEDLHLKNKKVAVFGLGDEAYAHFGGGADVLTTFVKNKGAIIVSDPLKIDSYYANQKNAHEKLRHWIETLPLST